jgi:PD-(D/E)XK nuclease superfamily
VVKTFSNKRGFPMVDEEKQVVIRCSSLSAWPDCPRRGAARLFRLEIEAAGYRLRSAPRGIGAVVGTAVHAGAQSALEEKAQTGELPPVNLALDAARDRLVEEIGRGEVAYDAATGTRADALRQVISMTRVYHRAVAPGVLPIIVEERLEAEVAPGVILSGQPDVVAREPHKVRDLKTGARAAAGSHAPQLGGYSLLARSHGLDIVEAEIDFVQRVGAGKPQPEPTSKVVAVALAETAASNILRSIEGDLRTFRDGDAARRVLPGDPWAFQANPNSILCSAKFCPAHGTDFCREWQQ